MNSSNRCLMTPEAGIQPHKYGGKELDRQNGLDWYDSQARWYDPALGRTTTMDSKAEDYPAVSPYAWCAGNPVRFTDPTGEEFTDRSWVYIELINNYAQKILSDNAVALSRLNQIVQNNPNESVLYETLIGLISNQNDEINATLEEISILSSSEQVYDICFDDSMSDEHWSTSYSGYDYDNDMAIMRVADTKEYTIAHELKHLYQFEIGELSFSRNEHGLPFYDNHDEIEAYRRGRYWGYPSSEIPTGYERYSKKKLGIGSLAPHLLNSTYLQSLSYRSRSAFRYNGKTYKYK